MTTPSPAECKDSTTQEQRLPAGELRLGEVVALRSLTEDLFLMEVGLEQPLEAAPGQFAMLKSTSNRLQPLLARPMSILGAGGVMTFLIRRCGEGTKLLTSLQAGDEISLIGPVGQGWGEPLDERRLVLVAGGVGLAPLLYAARALAQRGRRTTMLYGARCADELVLLGEIRAVAELKISTDDGSIGHHGLVTELLETELDAADVGEVWTCGPEPMMEAVAQRTQQNGVRCKVSVEARMACGRGLCLGCARADANDNPVYVCRDGPVFDAEALYGSPSEPSARDE